MQAPQHPGLYVRDTILKPKKLAVTKAAELVGVGRPAMSNFLNGRAAATAEMAARIEVAFGVEARNVMEMQAAFDAAQAKSVGAALTARPYVIALLEFKANDFERWVSRNIPARTRLAVMLRTLVNSTARPTRSDFPGNDDAERPGWDGWSECDAGNPWVPTGQAGWEFGVTEDVGSKANDDYAKSVKAVPAAQRLETTFVFVTPRRWSGKGGWLKKKLAEKRWKDVRAYDAADLEQWVAQSVSAQAWLATELGYPDQDVSSMDDAWQVWSGASKQILPAALFDTAVSSGRAKFLDWVHAPPDKPFVVASDSAEEALAFLSQLLPDEDAQLAQIRDRVVVFRAPGALRKLAKGTTTFIAVAVTNEVQKELAGAARDFHAVIVVPPNAAEVEADVVLKPLTSEAFNKALEAADYSRDEVSRLSRVSGRSLTILRRQVSDLPAVRTPPWAAEKANATALIPVYLAGSWDSQNVHDQAAVARMAGVIDYDEFEQNVLDLVALPQAPGWSVASYRGAVSKIDAMFATASLVTPAVLKRFFEQAKVILGEDDPKLDLPEDKRWAATVYDKKREYSKSLRDGIAETLVLLAVHGDRLFGERIGFDCNGTVEGVVRSLMQPVTTRRLEAAGGDLLAYAEAAPDVFLQVLERDLALPNPESHGLLRPADGFFGGCPRTYLLWALEGLAWSEKTLHRATTILAKLSKVEISDNWGNKPFASLVSIFRSWIPQTAADLETRIRVVRLIADKEPAVGWRLIVGLLNPHDRSASPNHKPRWRNDGYGHGEAVPTMGPIWDFLGSMAEMALTWPQPFSAEMLSELVELLPALSTEHADRLWTLVQQWAVSASDPDKALVREKVRVSVLSRRVAKHVARDDWATQTQKGRAALKLLEAKDVVYRHAWLFKTAWVTDSADELFEEPKFEEREVRIRELRTEAVKGVLAERGFEGLRLLASQGEAAHVMGNLCGDGLLNAEQVVDFALECASGEQDVTNKSLLAGVLGALPDDQRAALIDHLQAALEPLHFADVLLRAPFRRETWLIVDKLTEAQQTHYWQTVSAWHARDEDVAEAVRRLRVAGRPRAAFTVAHYQLDRLTPLGIYELLLQIAQPKGEETGDYKLDPHWLQKAFARLENASELTLEQRGILEFVYIDALWTRVGRKDKQLIPNLEKYLAQNPDFYVQALVWAYRRRDGQEDPPDMLALHGNKAAVADRAYKLLDTVTRLPTHGGSSTPLENLKSWIDHVRSRAQTLGRSEIADICLGRLLSAEPAAPDGVWPGQLARDVLEYVATDKIAQGAVVGRINSRGVVTRARGGVQERQLAASYQNWASQLRYSHPFVASDILEELAKSYERDGKREDESELLRERLV